MKYLFTVLSLIIIAMPQVVGAQGFVTCSGPDCDFCDLVNMGNTILSFLIQLATIIAVIVLAVAGLKLAASRGNTAALGEAKQRLLDIVIGIFIVVIAFTVVDVFLKMTLGGDFGVWNEIETENCGGEKQVGIAENTLEITEHDAPPLGDPNEVDYNLQNAISDHNLIMRAGSVPPPSREGQLCYSSTCVPAVTGVTNVYPGYDYPNSGPSQYIDLGITNLSTRLAPGFTLGELTRTSCRGKYAYLDPRAVSGVQRVRDILGTAVTINSGYRSPSCNRKIGGATHSQHMYGKAFDIQPPSGVSRATVVAACKKAGAAYTQIYDNLSHVHCDWR